MPINKWRYVQGTDDGCSIYQCLACYKQWETRTEPGYTDHEGVFRPNWTFCPYCGTRWEGSIAGAGERKLGRRRARIEAAIEKRRQEKHDRWRDGGYRESFDPPPPFWWVVEERVVWKWLDRDINTVSWEPKQRMRGLRICARHALAIARDHQRQLVINHAPRVGEEPDEHNTSICETRLVKVKVAEVAQRYPHGIGGYEVQQYNPQ